MRARLLAASIVSAALVLGSPFIGQMRAALRAAFPAQFGAIVAGAIAVAVGAAVLTGLARIRERRRQRYGAMVLALAIGVSYSLVTSSGVAEIDMVERVHFVEYGIVALLFFRVWRPDGDPSIFILPVLAGFVVGTLDEWLQWFVPVRVGEARDVLLNLIAIGCGVLFGAALEPPVTFAPRLGPTSRSRIGLTAASAVLVFAAFVSTVHLGYANTDERIGMFRSHYPLERLNALSRDRAERWRSDPPIVLKRFSREDQYMDEGLWHVRRRNESWSSGDYARAWNENLILESFFAPVLDVPSYATPQGNRWTVDQRVEAEEKAGTRTAFVSNAEPYPIVAWRKPLFWVAVAVAVVVILATTIV